MKAARFHGRHDLRIEEVQEPELRQGAVKIAVAWCGICGTDLHEFLEGPIFIPPPVVKPAGVVVGTAVKIIVHPLGGPATT